MITLLSGTNTYATSRYLRTQMDSFEGDITKLEGAEIEANQLGDLFMGATLFSARRMVVLRDVSQSKQLWADLEPWIERVPDETELYLVEANPDKRTKTYKMLQKHATVRTLEPLNEAELVIWLQTFARERKIDLSSDIARYFVSYVGHDQWRLQNEFDKLLLADKPLTRELIKDISEPYPEASAFELLDALFAGSTDRVEQLLTLLREREDPYQFFGLLSSQVFAVLALAVGGSRRTDDIAKDMGLHPFVVRKLAPIASRLGKKSIERLVERLAEADMRIKTSGIDPWEQISLTLLSSQPATKYTA